MAAVGLGLGQRYSEEREVWMIRPDFLLDDLSRALRKLGLEPEVRGRGGSWILRASKEGVEVSIGLESEARVIRGLEVLGRVPVSRIRVEAVGPGEFIRALKHRIEVELLRCLG